MDKEKDALWYLANAVSETGGMDANLTKKLWLLATKSFLENKIDGEIFGHIAHLLYNIFTDNSDFWERNEKEMGNVIDAVDHSRFEDGFDDNLRKMCKDYYEENKDFISGKDVSF